MDYSIKIEEKLSRIVNIKAESEVDAIALIEELYFKEKIVLDESDYDGQVMFSKVKLIKGRENMSHLKI